MFFKKILLKKFAKFTAWNLRRRTVQRRIQNQVKHLRWRFWIPFPCEQLLLKDLHLNIGPYAFAILSKEMKPSGNINHRKQWKVFVNFFSVAFLEIEWQKLLNFSSKILFLFWLPDRAENKQNFANIFLWFSGTPGHLPQSITTIFTDCFMAPMALKFQSFTTRIFSFHSMLARVGNFYW